ncbi:MAG TPA: triphosphoribosyl-dephospho-CoA synthase [Pirellula sp.]|nr:triphosphoribosyl-dephospho-CoA synthase [Pirellula sp.]
MSELTIGQRVQWAIETECSAIKAGNVHPYASFRDLSHQHFVIAANSIGQAMDLNIGQSVGQLVLRSVQAMMGAVGTNTSLGTILLMAPLAVATSRLSSKQSGTKTLQGCVRETLAALEPDDSRDIYQAIRIAKPGGLGESESMDIGRPAPENILEAMRIAAAWDDIALQYVSDFELVFAISRQIEYQHSGGLTLLDAIRYVQIEVMAERVDSLIARKQGISVAKQVQAQAIQVIESGSFGSDEYLAAWHRFDHKLRDNEHRNNPGTLADIISASLYTCGSLNPSK